ncbi:MAG: sigma-54-dependent Fis family transcriptional regulator, partial [Myxococcales bacterium]|nr:sigma-54-dependent Fis family transcriptional regulator [Myxococcales bacterium]
LSISHCLDLTRLREENQDLRQRAGWSATLLGESAAMESLREQIALAADSVAPVLVLGARGTGKELVARAIHEASKRKGGPLEKLNCAAVPSELIESELFGHEAGAFTGATKQRKGKFERADGGTLFLDEVGDMPLPMQAKLLRVLQEGELERVGGSGLIQVDVRVVAATNKPLSEEIAEGRFRADLFDRLNVLPLSVPALRDRVGDIPLLAQHFVAQSVKANDRPGKTLSAEALALLSAYDFPGNVRELRNLVERLVILSPGKIIAESDARRLLPLGSSGAGAGQYRPGVGLRAMLEDMEREIIRRALDHHQQHVTQTAADLQLERSHLYKKMKALGIRD